MGGSDVPEPVETTSAEAEDAEDVKPAGDEEDTGAEIAPIVKLDAVAVSTGEENEETLIDLKAKLYRFDKDGNQWKERGVGVVKLLKHKDSQKIRLVMRQNKTLKICANHTVLPSYSLQEHQGSDKTWVWHASDFADGELKEELFCIRFASADNAQQFKKAFEDAQEAMAAKLGSGDNGAEEKVIEQLEELKVVDGTKEKAEESKEESKEAKATDKAEESKDNVEDAKPATEDTEGK